MQGGQYRDVLDLRREGLSSVLYLNSGASNSNKLVLLSTSEMTYADIESELNALFECDIDRLKVKRIDLAVDVNDYSVKWFKGHTSVKRKRSGCEFGKLYRDERCLIETLIFGTRPNVIRIYDKLAQMRVQGRRQQLQWQSSGVVSRAPDESWERSGSVTRVERQYGGRMIPQQLATLRNLREESANINPFDVLEFSAATNISDIPQHLGGSAYLKLVGVQSLIEKLGYQQATSVLNERTGGKGKKLMRNIESLIAPTEILVVPHLYALYQGSLAAQLGVPCSAR